MSEHKQEAEKLVSEIIGISEKIKGLTKGGDEEESILEQYKGLAHDKIIDLQTLQNTTKNDSEAKEYFNKINTPGSELKKAFEKITLKELPKQEGQSLSGP